MYGINKMGFDMTWVGKLWFAAKATERFNIKQCKRSETFRNVKVGEPIVDTVFSSRKASVYTIRHN